MTLQEIVADISVARNDIVAPRSLCGNVFERTTCCDIYIHCNRGEDDGVATGSSPKPSSRTSEKLHQQTQKALIS
jgi:hypothetical protein